MLIERPVRVERTGWRDLALNDRHRQWGWNCPAIDLDCLFLEYDQGKAVAIIEYKHERAAPQRAVHPSYQAMIDLGTRAGVPVFAARYGDDFSWFKVIPLNVLAQETIAGRPTMTEREYVGFLYLLRGRVVPESVLDGIDTEV